MTSYHEFRLWEGEKVGAKKGNQREVNHEGGGDVHHHQSKGDG